MHIRGRDGYFIIRIPNSQEIQDENSNWNSFFDRLRNSKYFLIETSLMLFCVSTEKGVTHFFLQCRWRPFAKATGGNVPFPPSHTLVIRNGKQAGKWVLIWIFSGCMWVSVIWQISEMCFLICCSSLNYNFKIFSPKLRLHVTKEVHFVEMLEIQRKWWMQLIKCTNIKV